MANVRTLLQPDGGVAVILPSRHAAAAARPTHVSALLTDHGTAARGPDEPASARLRVVSAEGDAITRPQWEIGPIPAEGELDISVRLDEPEPAGPILLNVKLDASAGALRSGPCYVALFPRDPQVDVGALSVIDGRLRLGGAPIRSLDYALVRLVGAERPDLAALRDLEELRERLLAIYRTGTADEVERALREALGVIDAHPGLLDADRRRLGAALRREHRERSRRGLESIAKGGAPWADFVTGLPADEPPRQAARGGGAMPEAAPEAAPAPKPVHWNVSLLDGERALAELFVTVGRAYTIETGLDPAALAEALVSSTIAPGGLPDGTQVTFEVSCPQAILRGHGDAAGEPATRVSHTAAYDAATGRCPPARFGLAPAAPGRIPLTLSLVTDNAIRASAALTLQAAAAAPEQARQVAPPPASPVQARPIEVSAAALTGPPAQLRLELTATDQLVLSDSVVVEKPRDPAAHRSVLGTEAVKARAELVALSAAYRRDRARPSELAIADAPAMCLRMARTGAALHKLFFGTPRDRGTDADLKRLAQTIADTPAPGGLARLQIVAAFQPFPWAVLYDGAYRGKPLTDDPASVDLSCFWGHRFRIDRMIMGHASAARPPTLTAPVRVQACLNRHLDDEPTARSLDVKVIANQRALFEGIPGVAPYPRVESAADFVAYLGSETACDLLYVFCHATAAVTRDALFTYADQVPDLQAKLIFEPPPAAPVDVAAMQVHRELPLAGRPLVFLNACSTAAGDEAFPPPLLEQFLDRWAAAGVLGTDWDVPAAFADAFSRRLLGHFLRGGQPLGEAFWLASHEAFAEGNPFPLIYALYARPDFITTAPSKGSDHE